VAPHTGLDVKLFLQTRALCTETFCPHLARMCQMPCLIQIQLFYHLMCIWKIKYW